MAKSVYFNNCIREIRQSVYGRDNRKPIADAIEQVRDLYPGHSIIKGIKEYYTQLDESVVDWIEKVPRTVYTVFAIKSPSGSGLSMKRTNSAGDYFLYDFMSGDSIGVSGGENTLLLSDGRWSDLSIANEIVETPEDTGGIVIVSENDYSLKDSRTSDSIQLKNGDDYILTLGDSNWTMEGLPEESYIVYDDLPHHETYKLILNTVS